MNIELIYFEGCPNAERARLNVRQALGEAGIEAELVEWEQADEAAPAYVREHGSPTVLVAGRDVTGAEARGAPEGAPAETCRVDGAPTVEEIRAALR